MSMNLDRHITAHKDFFMHLVKNDGDSAEKHRDFYDEYLAVMDLTAEFYLQTVETVFIRHALPKGEMTHRGAAGRSGGDPQRRLAHRRGRERRHFRRRPDAGRARPSAPTSRPTGAPTTCSPPSATTASSTARASAPRSCRASSTSWRASAATRAAGRSRGSSIRPSPERHRPSGGRYGIVTSAPEQRSNRIGWRTAAT